MARTGYQYETSPRKLQPSYKPKKKQNIRVIEQKRQKVRVSSGERKKQVKTTLTIVAIFALLL